MLAMPGIVVCAAAVAWASAAPAAAQNLPLKVIVFPGLSNLAIFSAQHKGLFAKHNIAIEVVDTPNSTEQRSGLAAGRYDIAHTAVDNAVAMSETANADVAVVTGGHGGMNLLIAQQEIKSIEDLRGKTVVVDAPNTAYALLLYKMLQVKGLERGKDYNVNPVGGTGQRIAAMRKDKANAWAGMVSPPLSVQVVKEGAFKSLGSANAVVGEYQADSIVVMRGWAKKNEDVLIRYLRANIEGSRWALDPANRVEVVKLLESRLKLSNELAADVLAAGLDRKAGGFAKDLAFNMEGFKTVLTLRAELLGQWGGKPPAPDKFLDMSYYQKALSGLK